MAETRGRRKRRRWRTDVRRAMAARCGERGTLMRNGKEAEGCARAGGGIYRSYIVLFVLDEKLVQQHVFKLVDRECKSYLFYLFHGADSLDNWFEKYTQRT